MAKFVTRDKKSIIIKFTPRSDELTDLLNNIIPRLSYDEILDGELENRLKDLAVDVESLDLSISDDIKKDPVKQGCFRCIVKANEGLEISVLPAAFVSRMMQEIEDSPGISLRIE